ncbi:MAG: DUF4203 domain-containing protein [Nocardioides sp.]
MTSTVVLIALGAILCFWGAKSLRLTVLAAGFAGSWVLAEAFGASLAVAAIVAVVCAVAVLVLTLVFARFLFFIVGAGVGVLIGARLFTLLSSRSQNGHADVLLGLLFVAAVAIVCGFLANRFRRWFVVWTTALAGSALLLAGIGHLGPGPGELARPGSTSGSVITGVLWLAITYLGARVQRAKD